MDNLHESGQAGALSQLEITPAMIEAGVTVFRKWFDLPENVDCLASMPSDQAVLGLLSASFASMTAARPDSA